MPAHDCIYETLSFRADRDETVRHQYIVGRYNPVPLITNMNPVAIPRQSLVRETLGVLAVPRLARWVPIECQQIQCTFRNILDDIFRGQLLYALAKRLRSGVSFKAREVAAQSRNVRSGRRRARYGILQDHV